MTSEKGRVGGRNLTNGDVTAEKVGECKDLGGPLWMLWSVEGKMWRGKKLECFFHT